MDRGLSRLGTDVARISLDSISTVFSMIRDAVSRCVAMLHRGRFTEQFSQERLEHVFGEKHVHANLDIYESKYKKACEIDVLVVRPRNRPTGQVKETDS
jgi:hypothetical protein